MMRFARVAAAVAGAVVGVQALVVAPAYTATVPGVITEFTVPTAFSQPTGIAAGPDGNVWFVESSGNKIGRISTSGVITEFSIPTGASQPTGIAAGPDGNLWFTESSGNKIGRISPAGVITEFTVPTAGSAPSGIAAGPDGNLWFTEYTGNKIGRISPSGVIAEFPLPPSSAPYGIAAGPDGNLWFTEFGVNQIGRITPAGVIDEFPLPPSSKPYGIATGPDGNLWFTDIGLNSIGRISPSGSITGFALPTAGSTPYGIAAGPDGNLWFAEVSGSRIGRISPSGVITEFAVPTVGGGPNGIAAGSDGNLWFSELAAKIGRITSGMSPADRRPVLSGSGQAGLPLVCAADVWGEGVAATVSWQRAGVTIGGESGIVYTPTAADVGSAVTCSSQGSPAAVLATMTAVSNPITVAAQVSGPPGSPGPSGTTGPTGLTGPPGTDGVVVLAAVFAPGTVSAKAGKKLKVKYGVTNAASVKFTLKGKKTVTKQVSAKAGVNTLKWKLPKSLKAGKYTLRLSFQGTVKAKTKVKVKK